MKCFSCIRVLDNAYAYYLFRAQGNSSVLFQTMLFVRVCNISVGWIGLNGAIVSLIMYDPSEDDIRHTIYLLALCLPHKLVPTLLSHALHYNITSSAHRYTTGRLYHSSQHTYQAQLLGELSELEINSNELWYFKWMGIN